LWPIFPAAAYRFGRIFEAIAIATAISLLSSIIVTRTDPSATFFLTPFRIYEIWVWRAGPLPAKEIVLEQCYQGGALWSWGHFYRRKRDNVPA